MKLVVFDQSQIRKIAYALRASGAFPQLLGLERGTSATVPCEVLASVLRAGASETRPYQCFGPMAGIVASQPMSKITLRRIVTLGTPLLYQKPLMMEQ